MSDEKDLVHDGAYMCIPIEDYEANYLTEEKKSGVYKHMLVLMGIGHRSEEAAYRVQNVLKTLNLKYRHLTYISE